MSIRADISNFYRDDIAHLEISFTLEQGIKQGIKKISPLSRMDFMVGAGLATLFLVHKVGLYIFTLARCVVTGPNQDLRNSLSRNWKEILVYGGAIPLGWIGVIYPPFVNDILQIPANGLSMPYSL